MALSEREQKVLEQLEELMSNEDPNFASSMSSTGNTAPVFSARQLALGILCVLIGLGIIIGAVASHLIWLGVLGFLFAAFGVYFASTSKKTPVDSFLGGKAGGAARSAFSCPAFSCPAPFRSGPFWGGGLWALLSILLRTASWLPRVKAYIARPE